MKHEKLDENSFKLLSNRQLREAAEIAHREVVSKRKDPHWSDTEFIAQCWMEGLLSVLIKEGKVKLL